VQFYSFYSSKSNYQIGDEMAKAVKEEYGHYPEKGLKVLGMMLFVTGLLRYFGFGWDVVLMVVGLLLMLKACLLKYKKFKK
jgi:hypothetical protein